MRQGDTISPKLFTSTLESIFRRLNWENKGLEIDGEYLNHLRFKDNTPIYVNNTQIENVESYVYLGQRFSLRDKNQDKEILRRITAGWTAYAKHRDIFKSNFSICLKRKVYNSCVLPAMTYGAEIWSLTKQAQKKLAAAQTKMERSTERQTPG